MEKTLTVNRSMTEIHSVSENILDSLGLGNLGLQEDELQRLIIETRIVLYELYSNAVKHSQGEEIIFRFKIENEQIIINVETTGSGYKIKPIQDSSLNEGFYKEHYFPPFPNEIIGKKMVIYSDSEYNVFCIVQDAYCLSFGCDLKSYNAELTEDLNEHYGVFLLNKLCSEVKYVFNQNKETVTIKKGIKN